MDIQNPIDEEVNEFIKEALTKAMAEALSKIDITEEPFEREIIELMGDDDKWIYKL